MTSCMWKAVILGSMLLCATFLEVLNLLSEFECSIIGKLDHSLFWHASQLYESWRQSQKSTKNVQHPHTHSKRKVYSIYILYTKYINILYYIELMYAVYITAQRLYRETKSHWHNHCFICGVEGFRDPYLWHSGAGAALWEGLHTKELPILEDSDKSKHIFAGQRSLTYSFSSDLRSPGFY